MKKTFMNRFFEKLFKKSWKLPSGFVVASPTSLLIVPTPKLLKKIKNYKIKLK